MSVPERFTPNTSEILAKADAYAQEASDTGDVVPALLAVYLQLRHAEEAAWERSEKLLTHLGLLGGAINDLAKEVQTARTQGVRIT